MDWFFFSLLLCFFWPRHISHQQFDILLKPAKNVSLKKLHKQSNAYNVTSNAETSRERIRSHHYFLLPKGLETGSQPGLETVSLEGFLPFKARAPHMLSTPFIWSGGLCKCAPSLASVSTRVNGAACPDDSPSARPDHISSRRRKTARRRKRQRRLWLCLWLKF